MGADLGALFHHDDGDVRRELLEPDRGGKAGRPGADDDDVELHRLAGGKVRCTHGLLHNSAQKTIFHAFIPRIDCNGSSINSSSTMNPAAKRRTRSDRLLPRCRGRRAPRRGAGRPLRGSSRNSSLPAEPKLARRRPHRNERRRSSDRRPRLAGSPAALQPSPSARKIVRAGRPGLARGRRHGGARRRQKRAKPRRAARAARNVRRLHAARHRDAAGFRRRQSARRASCSSAKRRDATKISPACLLSAARENCST